jgi:hypothetical protein
VNRAERRRLLKEGDSTDKLKRWLNGLTADQRKLFSLTVNKAVDKEPDRINKDTVCVLDSCYATAIDDNLDISVNDIKKIVIEANAYMEEVKEYLRENREGYFMKIEDEKLINEVKKDIVDLMKSATVKSKALAQLKKKHNLPANVLNDLWLQVKSENSKAYNKHTPTKFKEEPTLEEEKEKFLHNIGMEMQEILNGEVAADTEDKTLMKSEAENASIKSIMEHKESGKVIITVESKPTLKIKSMIIEGQYETYEKGSEGVKTKNIIVKDTKDLADYKESVGKEYTRRKQELLDKLEEVKTEIEQLENKASKNFGIIEEIEQIFNM